MVEKLHPDAIAALVHANHGNPRDILGLHSIGEEKLVIRAFRPTAKQLFLIDETAKSTKKMAMEIRNEAGFFELELAGNSEKFAYSFLEINHEGKEIAFVYESRRHVL